MSSVVFQNTVINYSSTDNEKINSSTSVCSVIKTFTANHVHMVNVVHVKSTTLCPVLRTLSFCSIVYKGCVYKLKIRSSDLTVDSNINSTAVTIGSDIKVELTIKCINETSYCTTIWSLVFCEITVKYFHLSHTGPKRSTTIRNKGRIVLEHTVSSVVGKC